MSEPLEKNATDGSEYPRTIELENSYVNIIADLWGAPEKSFIGKPFLFRKHHVKVMNVFAKDDFLYHCFIPLGQPEI